MFVVRIAFDDKRGPHPEAPEGGTGAGRLQGSESSAGSRGKNHEFTGFSAAGESAGRELGGDTG